jgi:uncharacterized protein YkwD
MEKVKNTEEFRLRVIDEINFVRRNPQSYAEKIRKFATYFKGKILKIPETTPIMTSEGAKAFEEAAFYLDNLDSLPNLKYCPGLAHSAHEALLDIQKYEDINELDILNIDAYLSKHGKVVGHFAQAVDFGSSSPELVVINLLVDDGDNSRGNRMNILDPKFKLIGVSTGNHLVYHNCTVLMYASHFFNNNESPGELSDENYESEEEEVIETQTKTVEVKTTQSTSKNKNISNMPENNKLNVLRRSSLDKKYEEFHEESGDYVKSITNISGKNKNNKDDTKSLTRQLIDMKLKEKYHEAEMVEEGKKILISENKKKSNLSDDDFDLPEGVLKIEKSEKIVVESGIKKKVVKVIKHMEDGTVETEIYKEKI